MSVNGEISNVSSNLILPGRAKEPSAINHKAKISKVVDISRFSEIYKLLRVTALVLRAVIRFKKKKKCM